MLSRKNYAAIADIIWNETSRCNGEQTYQDKNGDFRYSSTGEFCNHFEGTINTPELVSALSNYFYKDNENFDWYKFRAACGYQDKRENLLQLEMEGVDT